MPTLEQHMTDPTHKILVLGHPGVGKTGLLGSLANAGFRLFIVDFDNNLDILHDPEVVKPEFRKNIYWQTFTDRLKGPRALPDGVPQASQKALAALDKWEEPQPDGSKKDMGNPYKWTRQDVLVLDSLTMFGEALKRYVAALNGRLGQNLRPTDWGEAMRIQEDALASICAEQINCHVVVIAHLTTVKDEAAGLDAQAASKMFPSALGSKLPPKIARYFNSVLLVEKQVIGSTVKRVLKTNATYNVDLKNPSPSRVPPEMKPDLAEYFRLIEGAPAPSVAPASVPIQAVR